MLELGERGLRDQQVLGYWAVGHLDRRVLLVQGSALHRILLVILHTITLEAWVELMRAKHLLLLGPHLLVQEQVLLLPGKLLLFAQLLLEEHLHFVWLLSAMKLARLIFSGLPRHSLISDSFFRLRVFLCLCNQIVVCVLGTLRSNWLFQIKLAHEKLVDDLFLFPLQLVEPLCIPDALLLLQLLHVGFLVSVDLVLPVGARNGHFQDQSKVDDHIQGCEK